MMNSVEEGNVISSIRQKTLLLSHFQNMLTYL